MADFFDEEDICILKECMNLLDEYNRNENKLKLYFEKVMWNVLLDKKNKFCSIAEILPGKMYSYHDTMKLCRIAKQITTENPGIFEVNMTGTAFRIREQHPTSIAVSILLGKKWT